MTSHSFVVPSTPNKQLEDNSDSIATASLEQLLVMISRDRTENEADRVALESQRSLRLATQTRLSNLLDSVQKGGMKVVYQSVKGSCFRVATDTVRAFAQRAVNFCSQMSMFSEQVIAITGPNTLTPYTSIEAEQKANEQKLLAEAKQRQERILAEAKVKALAAVAVRAKADVMRQMDALNKAQQLAAFAEAEVRNHRGMLDATPPVQMFVSDAHVPPPSLVHQATLAPPAPAQVPAAGSAAPKVIPNVSTQNKAPALMDMEVEPSTPVTMKIRDTRKKKKREPGTTSWDRRPLSPMRSKAPVVKTKSRVLRPLSDRTREIEELLRAFPNGKIALSYIGKAYNNHFGRALDYAGHSKLVTYLRSMTAGNFDITSDGKAMNVVLRRSRVESASPARPERQPASNSASFKSSGEAEESDICVHFNESRCRFSRVLCPKQHICDECGSKTHGSKECRDNCEDSFYD